MTAIPFRGRSRLSPLARREARQGLLYISPWLLGFIFLTLFPNVMPSSLNDAWSLTVTNASSSPYTLKIMTWCAVIATPIVMLYQGWTYWVFRKRIGTQHIAAEAAAGSAH